MRFTPQKPSLFGETLESLKGQIEAAGHKSFRANQVMDWLYKKRVDSWNAMTNLPKDFRAWLDENFILYPTAASWRYTALKPLFSKHFFELALE